MFGSNWFRKEENIWVSFETEAMPFLSDLNRLALWLTRDRTEAEDLVQETMMQALKSFHGYQKGTNAKAWLSTILYNTNAKRLQKLNRLRVVDKSEEKIAETIAFEPPIPQSLTDEDIIQALKDLPESFRNVVVLSDVEEFSYKEISEILRVPIGTVMSRLSRGRKTLRLALAKFANEIGIKNLEKSASG